MALKVKEGREGMPPLLSLLLLLLSMASERGSKGGEEGGDSVMNREVGTCVAWLLLMLLTSCGPPKGSWGELMSMEDENDDMIGAWAEEGWKEGWKGEGIVVPGRMSMSPSRRDGRMLLLLLLLLLLEFVGTDAGAGAVIQAVSNPREGGAGGRKEKDGNGAVAGGVGEKENGNSDVDATGAGEAGEAGGGGEGAAGSASWKSSHSWSSTTASNAAIREAMSLLLPAAVPAAASTTGLLLNVGMDGARVITGTGRTGVGWATVCGVASKEGGDEGIIGATTSGGTVAIIGAGAGDSVSVSIAGCGGVCIAMVDIEGETTTVGLAATADAGAMRRGGN